MFPCFIILILQILRITSNATKTTFLAIKCFWCNNGWQRSFLSSWKVLWCYVNQGQDWAASVFSSFFGHGYSHERVLILSLNWNITGTSYILCLTQLDATNNSWFQLEPTGTWVDSYSWGKHQLQLYWSVFFQPEHRIVAICHQNWHTFTD